MPVYQHLPAGFYVAGDGGETRYLPVISRVEGPSSAAFGEVTDLNVPLIESDLHVSSISRRYTSAWRLLSLLDTWRKGV